MTEQKNPCRLYMITPPRVVLPAFAESLKAALDAGDVAALQVRLKDTPDDEVCRVAEALLPIARAHDVTVIMNDRPDLAVRTGCDGVHIGQEDAAYEAARGAVDADGIVGVTCHDSRHLALEAGEKGADYVAFGAFFPTGTKTPKTAATPDILEWWSDIMVIPCVAIGGITPENCGPLVKAGADFLAVVSAVWDHKDGPAAAVKAFNRAIDAARG
ncbi:MAG: thiamine phosphate synthase [Alphaproteobacteria bacterium]|nr:thiamine phosphate synthase [Alphaproteobacteria bacterium]